MTPLAATLPREELRSLAREYGLVELSVFGSIARGDSRPAAISTCCMSPDPVRHRGWLSMSWGAKLERLLGRPVDLVPKDHLHWVVRDRVVAKAEVIYAT